MTVCIAGKDSVALFYGVEIAAKAAPVTLCNFSWEVLDSMANGHCPFPEEPGLKSRFEGIKTPDQLRVSHDIAEATAGADLVMVFESLDRDDYTPLDYLMTEISKGLNPGNMVLINGRVRVGDTRGRLCRMLEKGSGLKGGRDFNMGFSTERCRPNHFLTDLSVYPKIVAADTEAVSKTLAGFLQTVLDTAIVRAHNIETLEYVNLMEAGVRHVNAALAIELAQKAKAHHIDLSEAWALAQSQSQLPIPAPELDGSAAGPALLLGNGLITNAQSIRENAVLNIIPRIKKQVGDLKGKEVALIVDDQYQILDSKLLTGLREAGARIRVMDGAQKQDREKINVIILLGQRISFAALELSAYPNCQVLLDGASTLGPRRVEAAGVAYLGPV